MKRKVIKQGNGTLTITLPKEWTKKVGLKGGDEIDVEENINMMIINSNVKQQTQKISLNLKNLQSPRAIRWVLSALHKNGFDEIELNYENENISKIVQEQMKNLYTGFAVMEQSKKRMIIRSVSIDVYEEMEPSLRRAFLVTLSLAEGLGEKIKNNDFTNIIELNALEKSNNQFTNFSERMILKKGFMMKEKTPLKYLIVWNLEKICDVYKDLCDYIEEKKIKTISKQISNYYNDVSQFLRKFYEAIYKFDVSLFDKLQEEERIISKKLKQYSPSKKEEYEIMFLLRNILERTLNFSGPIIGLNLKND